MDHEQKHSAQDIAVSSPASTSNSNKKANNSDDDDSETRIVTLDTIIRRGLLEKMPMTAKDIDNIIPNAIQKEREKQAADKKRKLLTNTMAGTGGSTAAGTGGGSSGGGGNGGGVDSSDDDQSSEYDSVKDVNINTELDGKLKQQPALNLTTKYQHNTDEVLNLSTKNNPRFIDVNSDRSVTLDSAHHNTNREYFDGEPSSSRTKKPRRKIDEIPFEDECSESLKRNNKRLHPNNPYPESDFEHLTIKRERKLKMSHTTKDSNAPSILSPVNRAKDSNTFK